MMEKEVNIYNKDQVSLKEVFVQLKKWFNFILSKWLVLGIAGILGSLIGVTCSFLIKPTYIASSTFVLEEGESGGGLAQYAGLASMVGIDIGGGGGGLFQGDNIIELYRSRTMIQKTLLTNINTDGQKELLIERYLEFKGLRKKWKDEVRLRDLSFVDDSSKSSRLQDSVLGKATEDIIQNLLTVGKPDKKLSIIKVDIKSPDEVFSKEFNDQIVRNVNEFYVQTKTKRSMANIGILQKKTDSVRAVLNTAIYTAAAAGDATPNLNPTRQVQRVVPVQRSQISAETNKVILGELIKNLELSKIALSKETPLIQIIDQPILPLKMNKIGILKGIVFGAIAFGFLMLLLMTIKYLSNDQST